MRPFAILLATGFGIGRLPVAPATWASAAVALLLLPEAFRSPLALGVAILVVTPLAIWTSGEAEKELGHDAHPIVIDEVAGMLVSVVAVPHASSSPALFLVSAFFLFRFFDIVKPFPIRQSQVLPGGWGIVADDLLAGVATNLTLRLALLAGAPL
ncbi:MAG TPA: phosphatidylglycerophosphatase A [Candidatus Eisenbacteria bacterium]|nr:phosphatidylglycerophosphatase A [Candidatus Eisenbacteria bacterium]